MRVASLKLAIFFLPFLWFREGDEGVGWVWGDGDIPGDSFYIKVKKMCCCEGLFTDRKIVHLWFRAEGEGYGWVLGAYFLFFLWFREGMRGGLGDGRW